MNIRRSIDGSYTVPVVNKQQLQELSDKYDKAVGENVWYPRCKEGKEIKDLFVGSRAYIVGKGPSLDYVTKDTFDPDVPIFCINDSIYKVSQTGITNPLFVVVQDVRFKDDLAIGYPVIISHSLRYWYADQEDKYIVNAPEITKVQFPITVVLATCVLKKIGVKDITYIAFDAFVNKDTHYAKCIGYSPLEFGRDVNRFLQHPHLLSSHIRGIKTKFLCPIPGRQETTPSSKSSDTLQQSPQHPVEHDVSVDIQSRILLPDTKDDSPSEKEHSQRANLHDHLGTEPLT